jgi:sugar/nucleoside kinase (ribokinase family)
MAKEFDILSLGSIYLDINCTSFPFEEGLKTETETVGERYSYSPGGSAVISALVAAHLGFKPVFIGKVGSDLFGETVTHLLQGQGIEPALIIGDNVQTNLSVNAINPQGKTLSLTVGSANPSLTAEEILRQMQTYLPQVQYLYLGGYFKLKTLTSHYPELIQRAKTLGVKIILDHGRISNTISSEQIKILKEIITQVDFYFPSEDEFCHVWECDSVEEGLAKVRTQTSAVIAVKQSDKGASSIDDAGHGIHVDSFTVTPLNTIGAGDSFNAGFLSAFSRGKSLTECLQYACATAAVKISTTQPLTTAVIEKMLQSSQ